MRVVIAPEYEHLRTWIEALPDTFESQGKVIYDARNQIRVITLPDGLQVNVKRYHAPRFVNRLIYTCLRPPKARRAYDNALRLQCLGIPTPTPVAYILCGRPLLAGSYLVTLQSPLKRNFYEFRHHPLAGYEDIVCRFARFTADMHRQGVLHLDYSPGNILFDVIDGQAHFALVDINRMRFGKPVSRREACRNFCRLWGKQDFFELLGREYAIARGWNVEDTQRLVIHYWKRFWRHRK